jgi:hypothetical protein
MEMNEQGLILFGMDMGMWMIILVQLVVDTGVGMGTSKVDKAGYNEYEKGLHVKMQKDKSARW